jgi:hypothetical protein
VAIGEGEKAGSETTAENRTPPSPAAAPNNSPEPIKGPVHAFLTAQLRAFVQQNGRLPESFAEFAGARLDSVPRLPAGLKFAIDPATQEVKVVRQP